MIKKLLVYCSIFSFVFWGVISCNKYCSTSPSGRDINAYKDLKTGTGNSTKGKGNNGQNKKIDQTIKRKYPVKIKRQYNQ